MANPLLSNHLLAEHRQRSRARDRLIAALEAWKAEEVPGLTKRRPPIRFVDDDYKAGLKLQDYAITGTTPIKPFAGVPVRLMLQDRARQTEERNVTYQVSLKPGLAILRSDP